MKHERRIVVIDLHVIAQWYEVGKWWTCSKANNNDENDFAVWMNMDEDVAIAKARKLVGSDAPIVRTMYRPIQRGNTWHFSAREWYISDQDMEAKSYYEALRALARTV